MGATPEQIGCDAKAWIERLRELSRSSRFTASQRAFIEMKLAELARDLDGPIPFVEDH